MVYDITNEASFTNVERWLGDVRQHAPATAEVMLVGTKSDLPRKVLAEDAQVLFQHHVCLILTLWT